MNGNDLQKWRLGLRVGDEVAVKAANGKHRIGMVTAARAREIIEQEAPRAKK